MKKVIYPSSYLLHRSVSHRLNQLCFLKYLAIVCLIFSSFFTTAQTYPSGFSQSSVASGIGNPTTMAFAPDGRIFIAQQTGQLRIVKNGALLATPFVTLNVSSSGERGLLGIAFDPNFNTNHYIYLYYTLSSGANNRISRFTANGDVAVAGSETVILNLDPLSTAENHNGGTMIFGTDGKLYVGVGENGNSANAQNLDTYLGKILRINTDGSVPSGNPFTGSAQKQRVWSYGLRNPYTLTMQPGTGKIYVNDVGQSTWEEINNATSGGLNFGWPAAEGNSTNSAYTNPVYAYDHSNGCAITGGAFFNPSSTNYPSTYTGNYFYMDYCGNWIDRLSFSGSTVTRSAFASNLPSSPVGVTLGPDGNLYFLGRTDGTLYKIVYSGGASAPVITSQPQSTTVSTGGTATFTVGVTGTAPLSVQWRKNGVNISGANGVSYSKSSVTSADAGTYSVVITNSAGTTTSNNAILTVSSNTIPVATITAPAAGTTYAGGNTISFSGNATDTEDGTLPASAFNWVVEFHHDSHIHPGPTAGSGIKSGSFTIPNSGETSSNVFYRLYLIVTDSQGAKDTAYTDISPRTSTITINTNPQGLQITLDGQPFTAPYTVTSVEGILRTIGTVSPQTNAGQTYAFQSWAHGGSSSQTIATPVNDVSYTATYAVSTTLRNPENPAHTVNGLKYKYYQGTWSTLPNFTNLNPSKKGNVYSFDLSPRSRNDNFGFRYDGYVNVPVDGNYTFYTTSDDGSKLYIGSTVIVNNDGLHGSQEKSGTIGLKAGKHAIRIDYFENTGGEVLSVSYSGPGITKQVIPAAQLFRLTGRNTVQLFSTGDAHVRSGTYASSNYGSVNRLYTRKQNPVQENSFESFVKFDISNVTGTVSDAKLRLYGKVIDATAGTIRVNVEVVESASWQEASVNYNNRPPVQKATIAFQDITSTQQYYEWDVTNYINVAKNAGINIVSFKLVNDQQSANSKVLFFSREAPSAFPILAISTPAQLVNDDDDNNPVDRVTDPSEISDLPQLNMNCFPNPASDNLSIAISGADPSKEVYLLIYSVDGKLIRKEKLQADLTNEISVSDLQNGTYLLGLKQDEQLTWQRIIVSH